TRIPSNGIDVRVFKGNELIQKMQELMDFGKVYEKLNRKIGTNGFLDALLKNLSGKIALEASELSPEDGFLSKRANVMEIVEGLKKDGYDAELHFDEEHSLYGIKVTQGSALPIWVDVELLSSVEWQQLMRLHDRVKEFRQGELLIREKDREAKVDSAQELVEHIVAAGKKNLSIQRYKGLGEMNPTQLWETTMNPETRTLLRVNIEDVIQTDDLFAILMGD